MYSKTGSIQAVIEYYAGELGIFTYFFGHKVDPKKKRKLHKAMIYLETQARATN